MKQSSQGGVTSTPHKVTRLTVEIPGSYESFRDRYEAAVPRLEAQRLDELVESDASWADVLDATRTNAPHDFIRYWSQDFSPLMRLAGHELPGTEYLMGNHVIAEEMYAEDPATVLYAPLRTAIYADAGGTTRFTVDQPSTVFASFGNSRITDVGLHLDRELAALLGFLDVPIPTEIMPGSGP